MKFLIKSLTIAVLTLLTACGGGGGDGTTTTSNYSTVATTTTTYSGALRTLVATSAAGENSLLKLADCTRFTTPDVSPTIIGADMQEVSDVLHAIDPNGSYLQFARNPDDVMWWLRTDAKSLLINGFQNVNIMTLGTAIHEGLHRVNFF